MEELLRQFLENSTGLVAYGSVFGVLVACGLGVPLPEDVSLILGGYLVHQGAARLFAMMAVGFFGILAGDSLIYLAGRRIGSSVGKRPGGFIARIVTPQKRATVEGLFKRHGEKIVMIARFLPGVRAVTYFTAGSAKMSYPHFLLFDGLAALASAPLFVFLGFRFGGELEHLVQAVKRGQLRVIGGILAVGLAYALVSLIRKRRAEAKAKAELVSRPLPAASTPAASVEGAPRRYEPPTTGTRLTAAK